MNRHLEHGFAAFGELLHDLEYHHSYCALDMVGVRSSSCGSLTDLHTQLLYPCRVSPCSDSPRSTLDQSLNPADHYGSSEMIFGQFRKSRLEASQTLPIGATKWCIFKSPVSPYTRKEVEDAVRERMSRMKSDRLNLLQVHWQDYDDLTYVDTLQHLVHIKREGKIGIDALGLVNFDARRVDEICEFLGEGEIVTNQVQVGTVPVPDDCFHEVTSLSQFSLIDTRPLHGMAVVCAKHRVKLLTYGTLVRFIYFSLNSTHI